MSISLNTQSSENFSKRDFSPVVAATVAAQEHAGFAENLRHLHQTSVRKHYDRNETIFAEGESADHSYRIVSGIVRLCKYTSDGRRQIADFMMDGEFFGFMNLDEHSFTAEAVTNLILLSYPKNHIERLGEATPSVRKHVLSLLSQNIASMQQHLVLLGRQTAREKVAFFLLRMADRAGVVQGGGLNMSIGRQDMADHLGLTVETVCRVLSAFKQKRLIAVPNAQQITLCNVSALQSIVDAQNQ